MTRRILLALALVGTISTIGCGRDDQAVEGTTAAAGKVGSYYYVSMTTPPIGGWVSSSNGALLCGASARTVVNNQYVYTYYTTPSGVANKCTQAKVTWSQTVTLTANPASGYAFTSWAGDCSGAGTCTLSAGADKSVAAIFGVSGSGHPNYTSAALHGPAYFAFLSATAGALNCPSCHGANLTGQGIAPSCNTCHQADGWIGWQTNCSFCHGATTAAAKAGYTFSVHPDWAAPPTTVAQRNGAAADLTRTGAHQAHLLGVTPGGLAVGAFACATCHVVPSTLSHVSGQSARGAVALSGAGQGSLPTLLGDYNSATGTCTTYCHGSSPSPAWSSTGLACSGCHGLPPTTLHPTVTGGLTVCVLCHPDSVNADGTIKAGGKHLDGTVQAIGGHLPGYAAVAAHGPDALADRTSCTGCHGATFDGGFGPSCNACHASAGWSGWQTNCSFCHGAKTAAAKAGYALASAPALSAPPDAILQRLGGAASPARTGAHQIHLAGGPYAGAFKCETCHTVPTGLEHFAGSTTRATVILSGAGQASLPSNLGTYDQVSGRCATACHGTVASPAWSAAGGVVCGTCHALPPAPATGHPPVPSDVTTCVLCHKTTMNADGTINLASGNHVNGVVNVEGGHPNWSSPAVHGPIYFDYLNGGATLDCKICHGATLGGGVGPACASCHAAAGWTNWQSNCSFCHGTKSAATQAGYSVATNPTWSAPPDAISQRLGGPAAPARTGAHQAHLSNGAFTAGFACSTCHAVPTDLSHIGPSGNRATVTLSGTGQRSLPASLGSYDQATGTCATSCHGPAGSPAWSSPAPMVCGGCHTLPPAPATGHPSVSSSLPDCAICHPDTVNADGSLNVAGGKHLNGTIEAAGMHGDFSSPAVKAPAFFNFLAGTSTLDCKRCHGATYDGGIGPSCNACHVALGWIGWTTNCSFCHGAKTAASQAGYSVATNPGWAAPPDALAQRLDPAHVAVPERTGAHQIHLSGGPLGPSFTCATCHPVPTDLSHIEGANVRANVVLSPAGQFSLPANMGSYNQATGSCTTYCHGASGSPAWSSPPGGAYCGYCHGLPPSVASGHPNVPANLTYCYICHPTSINPDGTHKAGGTHLNGVKDASGMHGDYASPAVHGPKFFDYLNGVGTLDCKACHGADLNGGPIGPSCTACHTTAGWAGWQTNCSFCHGAKTTATKAGYSVASQPTWSAPPDAISQRLTGTAATARTGATRSTSPAARWPAPSSARPATRFRATSRTSAPMATGPPWRFPRPARPSSRPPWAPTARRAAPAPLTATVPRPRPPGPPAAWSAAPAMACRPPPAATRVSPAA